MSRASILRPLLPLLGTLLLGSAGAALAQAQAQTPILVGQSAGMSGGQAEYAKDVQLGIQAAFAHSNANGGIQGRRLQLVTLDDGGKRDAVLANTRKLVDENKVLALVGYTSGAGTEASLDFITQARVPLVGAATGNMGIRAAFNPYLFHTRAGYDDEMQKIVGHVASLGYTRVGLAYLADVGPANLKAMQAALAAHKLVAAAVVGLDRNASDFTPQVDVLMKADPQLIIFISNAKPIVAIVSAMRARRYGGQFATSSFAGARVVGDLKQDAAGLILIQVLPQPHRNQLKFQKDFHAGLQRVAPAIKPNYTILEGYVAGHVMVEALKRAGSGASRAELVNALESLTDMDLDGYRIRFGSKSRSGSHFVDLGVVTDTGRVRF